MKVEAKKKPCPDTVEEFVLTLTPFEANDLAVLVRLFPNGLTDLPKYPAGLNTYGMTRTLHKLRELLEPTYVGLNR